MRNQPLYCCLLFFFSLFFQISIAQNFPEAIALRKLKLKETTNPVEFQNFFKQVEEGLQKHALGTSVKLWFGDRGERKGQYIHTWMFELSANRDYYFPAADADDYSKFAALIQEMQVDLSMGDDRVEHGMDAYTDYVVVGFDQLLLPKIGEILALREIEIKPNMEAQFESYVNKTFHPTLQNYLDGFHGYVMRGDRGERLGKYLMVFSFDTADRRNFYFPEEGGDTPEALTEELNILNKLREELGKFIVEGSSDTYTDYISIH